MQVMTPICNSEHRPTANVLLGCFIDITLPRPTYFFFFAAPKYKSQKPGVRISLLPLAHMPEDVFVRLHEYSEEPTYPQLALMMSLDETHSGVRSVMKEDHQNRGRLRPRYVSEAACGCNI
jgi:hypothetical protein